MRLKLLLSFILVIFTAVGGMALVASRNTTSAVRAFMYRGGMTAAGGLATQLEQHYLEQGSWQGVDTLLTSMHGRQQGQGGMGMGGQGMGGTGMGMMTQRLRLADAAGQVVADTDGVASGSLSWSEQRDAIALSAGGQTVGYLLAEGSSAYNQAEEAYLVSRLTSAALTAGLIAAGVALLLALLLATRVMRPVRALTSAAQRLGQGDLSQRVSLDGDDELGLLAQSFNHMADSLQQAEDSRRALTADIAHELRTPLAVQRATLEALQDGVYALNAENLASVLEQNLLLTRLVDDLRTLALAEAGELKLERLPTDLAALVEQIAARFRAQAATHQIEISVAELPTPPIMLSLDAQRIEQILGNLLSNALRHTPDGGRIQVRVAAHGRGARVTVTDNGAGIPAEALPHVFERFYRADRSRSRQEGGAGLGLAIARRLVEAHGGTLTAANAPQGGAIFEVTL